MIKAKQIPDEVVQELIATLYGKPGLPYREAIAAAINVWPFKEYHSRHCLAFGGYGPAAIILPLTENTNAES